jgi:hypothetical protein
MRCFICNVAIEKPQFNSEHDDFDPCETCKQVIADTVAGYEDVVAVDEDQWAEPDGPEFAYDYEDEDWEDMYD